MTYTIFIQYFTCCGSLCLLSVLTKQPPRLLLLLYRYIPSTYTTITAADGQFETNNHLAHSTTLPHNSFARCYLLHIIWGGQLRYSGLLLSALFVTKYTRQYKNLLQKNAWRKTDFFVMLFGGVKGIFLIFDILGTYFLASIHYILKKYTWK